MGVLPRSARQDDNFYLLALVCHVPDIGTEIWIRDIINAKHLLPRAQAYTARNERGMTLTGGAFSLVRFFGQAKKWTEKQILRQYLSRITQVSLRFHNNSYNA